MAEGREGNGGVGPRTRRGIVVGAGLLVVLAAGAAAAGLFGGDGTPGAQPPTVPGAPASPAPATTTATGTADASDPTAGASPVSRALPIYYLADHDDELRLYREFHRVTSARSAAAAAVEELLTGEPRDPDYRSPWPAGTRLLALTTSGDTATVDLSAEATRNPGAGADTERLAVQQLVHTVTAAEPSVRRVRLLVAGREVTDLWGHGAVGRQPLTRAPRLEVQGLVWILEPEQDATVGSPVRIRVLGTAFEGTVILTVRRGATEVAQTVVTTAMGDFREASTTLRLPPGRYTLQAAEEDMRDGALQERDTKDFTVR